jgi:uncharacterized protein (TIGR02996 family)
MTERERFIRAIEAEPEEDTGRLVFADWLEENGEPDRARFIRLQCEYQRTCGPAWAPSDSEPCRELKREIDQLLERHREAWTAGLPAWAREEQRFWFQRGFLHIFQMTGKQFLEGAAALRAVAPLPTLFLRLLKGREEAVFASEHLGGVSWLRVECAQLTDAGVAALTASPHLRRLRRLWAGRSSFARDAKDANKLTDASALALAGADNLPALVDLDLSGYRKISLAAMRAIVESPRRAGLTGLNLSGGPGGPEVAELFRGPGNRLRGLQELRLSECKLGDAGVEALAGSAALGGLRLLWLTQNKIGDRGARALASSPHLSGLIDLDLWKNDLGDAGVLALLASEHLRGLRKLELGDNPRITDAAAGAILADNRAWAKVGLEGTRVSPALKAQVAEHCQRSGGGA